MERHKLYIGEHGDDMPEVRDWRWTRMRGPRLRLAERARAEQRLVVAQVRLVPRRFDSEPRTLFGETVATAEHPDAIDPGRQRSRSVRRLPPPDAIGHRIVHGGPTLRQHCLHRRCGAAASSKPLPPSRRCTHPRRWRSSASRKCTSPAFRRSRVSTPSFTPTCQKLRVCCRSPGSCRSDGIQRYGFHGLSLESIVRQLGDALPERLVIAHLGNGASITAVKAGLSIDTSMGMTPSGGVIMGTRSGDLDPGVLVYLMREKKFDAARLEALVDQRSGLLGISGSVATCGVCTKPLHRTAMHVWPSRCSAIQCANRWPR